MLRLLTMVVGNRMSDYCLVLTAPIDQRVVTILVPYLVDLRVAGARRLTLAISSPGGNVIAGVAIYNAMRSMPYQIVTHNIGNVDSIANVVFLAGTERYANESAAFMFHGVGFDWSANERLEEKNILEKLDVIRSEHKRISAIIASRSNLTSVACMNLFRQQRTRGAGWAQQKGLIDGIGQFLIPSGADLKHLT